MALAEPTGRIEELFDRAADPSVAAAVTHLLAEAVVANGGPIGRDGARNLTTGDRRWLVRQIGIALGRTERWITGVCSQCETPFDVHVDERELLDAEIGATFPEAVVANENQEQIKVRAPTGLDEEFAASTLPDPIEFANTLKQSGPDITEMELATVSEALEALGPATITTIATNCPECGGSETLNVDPYELIGVGGYSTLEEIHRIARAYHWSERDILDLPVARRQQYLALIDANTAARP